MRIVSSALALACALGALAAAPAHAGQDPGRQVLRPGDGWASSGTGTTGGSAAATEHVVRTAAELRAALAAPAPRLIRVRGVIDVRQDCSSYATDGYALPAYLAAYDPAVWGRDTEPSGPLEDARAASARNQQAAIGFAVGGDTTIVGEGRGAGLTGANLRVHGVSNVIIRNLTFRDTRDCFPQWDPTDGAEGNWNSAYDQVSLQRATNVWVDHNTFTDQPYPDSTSPVHFGRPFQQHDGSLDITSGSDLVTASYNLFEDHGKTMLIGSSNTSTTDPGKLRVSVHHNIFRNTEERLPRVRFGQVHVYNNLYEPGPTFVYAWGVGVQSALYVENNYVKLAGGGAVEDLIHNWGGTAITEVGTLVDGRPVDALDAFNAANPTARLSGDAGWTPTLKLGLEPAQRIKNLKAGAPQRERYHVAKGTDFDTVQAAVDAAPAGTTITIGKGVYREVLRVPATKRDLTLKGSTGTARDVVIDYDNASGTKKPDGTTYGTTGSATATVEADGFTARDLTFSNSFDRAAHPGITATQAVAVKATGDRQYYDRVRFLGHQDTLYADTRSATTRARQYYRGCEVVGDVDFVFGRATAVFDQTTIRALPRDGEPAGYVTAASTRRDNPHGFLIVNSTITSDAPAGSYYLGRPWHPGGDPDAVASVVIRDTRLPAAVKAAPWTDMSGFPWREARFAEYRNSGPGAGTGADRPALTDEQARQHTVRAYLGDWIPA
ncbi:pectinesterase family protein [Saccharothrix syringae]|uniref:pectinesterase family protein n=1 Tax=Saccharothrix syringae TaxID=103733 RepID=UPI0007C541CD|nr:pectinesterase family protein [Saccharothrix syringae]